MRLRRWWLKVHRWLGLSLGMVLVLAATTGSAMLVADPLDEVANAHLFRVANPASVDHGAVLRQARNAFGRNASLTLRPPREPDKSFQVLVRGPWNGTLFLHPATGLELGRRAESQGVMGFLFTLHSSLFAQEAGKAVLTLAALAYVILLASGICLWWPVRWRQALSFRRGAGLTRSLYDWHRVSGVVCGLLVLVSVVSGAYMAWPPLAKWVSHLSGAAQTRPPVVAGGPASTEVVQGSIERAQAMFPKAMVGYVQVPAQPDQALRVRLRLPDDPHPNGLTSVWFHPRDGEVIAVNRWSELDPGTRAYSYVYPLHTGELGGWPTAVATFLTGVMPMAFAGTGILLWWRRRPKASSK